MRLPKTSCGNIENIGRDALEDQERYLLIEAVNVGKLVEETWGTTLDSRRKEIETITFIKWMLVTRICFGIYSYYLR